ncbi:MAG: TIGR03086 family metal-binding protein, partial [Pseudonocardiales bacterium]
LLWAGLVTGQETVSAEVTMGAVAYDGDLATYADEMAERSLAMWQTPGLLTAVHATPFGELPGSVVVNFAIIDALCHAWDLSASLGRPLEFPAEHISAIDVVVEATCTDPVRELGLIKDVAPIARDASETDRLMAKAGRSRPDTSSLSRRA